MMKSRQKEFEDILKETMKNLGVEFVIKTNL